MENIIKFLPRDAVAFLRIADSDARFPIRPISEGSFLIGHGSACDLRLGDHEVPALHSILRVTSTSAFITLMAERPELFVNGESVPQAVLHDGDLVEIADVRVVFRFVNEESLPTALSASEEDDTPIELQKVEELTIPDLVTGLEMEFELLRELQSTSAETIDLLINAAQRSVEGASIKLAPPSLRLVGQEERFEAADREKLQEISSRVKQQESRLGDVCHVLEQIVSQQQIMTTALQSLADRLSELRNSVSGEPTTRRASA